MVNEELIFEIESRLQRGERKKDIKTNLIKNGWVEKEVDDAMVYLQLLALKEIPVIASVIKLWEGFEEKVTTLSARTAILLLGGLALLVILLGVGLYFIVDPLGSRTEARDEQRQVDFAKLKGALVNYYSKNTVYPARLTYLVPEYIQSVPKDPTGREYQYKLLDAGGYELCIPFELKEVQCVSSETSQNTQESVVETAIPPVNIPNSPTFIINGLVYTDANNDKFQQKDEPGIGSEIVYVADETGKEVCKKITDSKGSFMCAVEKSGAYYVFLDKKTTLKVLGAHPQRITVPPVENPTATSVNVMLRASASSGTAPIQ
jgi:hypothetical protein